jgi:hypothetical protein
MSTQPRSPAEHYADAERLLAAAESSVADGIQTVSALIAIGHALLAAAPRQARKRPPKHGAGPLPQSITWGDER